MKVKKFSKIMLAFVILLVAGVGVFAGCSPRLSGGPNKDDAVTSNGGLVVQKGDYLYFVNGYVDSSSSDNAYGKADQGAIYRAKLENNKLTYDEDGNLLNYDILVPKVAGFDKTNLYIFGNDLYYSTPNTEKDSTTGNVDEKLLDFYKIGLDGENNTRIYKSEVSSDNIEFGFYKYDKVYLTVYDTEKIVVIDCDSKNKTVISENVTSFVKPNVESENPKNTQQIDYNFYYTRKANDDEKIDGNKVCYFSLSEKQEKIAENTQNDKTYTLKQLSASFVSGDNSYVMYTYSQNSTEFYFASKIVDGKIDFSSEEKLVAKKQDNEVFLYTDTAMNSKVGVLTTNSSGYLTLITMKNAYEEDVVSFSKLGKMTILKVVGNKVFYYNDSNQMFVVSLSGASNNELTAKQLTNSDDTYDFSKSVKFDNSGDYVYIFKSYTGNEDSDGNSQTGLYLVRFNYNAETVTNELVGKLLQEHHYVEKED